MSVAATLSFATGGELRGVRDVFADPAYEEARARAHRLNKAIWDAHGDNFVPVGVGASKVEASYPLAKMIRRITAPGSPYEAKRGKGATGGSGHTPVGDGAVPGRTRSPAT